LCTGNAAAIATLNRFKAMRLLAVLVVLVKRVFVGAVLLKLMLIRAMQLSLDRGGVKSAGWLGSWCDPSAWLAC
jgi:hypothetical protein